MANEFEDFVSEKKMPEINFGGVFDCQTCGEEVYGAHRDAEARVLLWWCSKGHVSRIEKFSL